MSDLASADDVAHSLGLVDAAALTAAQVVRVDGLLARVSREFRREAGRVFTPGTSTVRLLSVAGRVRLPEAVVGEDDITSVVLTDDGTELDWTLDGQELVVSVSGRPLWSGVSVTVTFTHDGDVPDDVVATVAAIVARHLAVPPSDIEVSEDTVGPFRRNYADWWVRRRGQLLMEDERDQARGYRYPGSTIIIQKP